MTYFKTSIFRYRAVRRSNGSGSGYCYFVLHLPLRMEKCVNGTELLVCKVQDVPMVSMFPKDEIDLVGDCLCPPVGKINITSVRPLVYERRKYGRVYKECRVPITMYIRKELAGMYGTDFLVYYDKEKPVVVAFPASPKVPVPDCVRNMILRSLERPTTFVRSFSPEEIYIILNPEMDRQKMEIQYNKP